MTDAVATTEQGLSVRASWTQEQLKTGVELVCNSNNGDCTSDSLLMILVKTQIKFQSSVDNSDYDIGDTEAIPKRPSVKRSALADIHDSGKRL